MGLPLLNLLKLSNLNQMLIVGSRMHVIAVCISSLLVFESHGSELDRVSRWGSARDSDDRLSPQPPLTFAPSRKVASNTSILDVKASDIMQTIWGFGGGITESAVSVFDKLDAATQSDFLLDLFGENPDNTSLRYTGGRLTIGSCDYSLGFCEYGTDWW